MHLAHNRRDSIDADLLDSLRLDHLHAVLQNARYFRLLALQLLEQIPAEDVVAVARAPARDCLLGREEAHGQVERDAVAELGAVDLVQVDVRVDLQLLASYGERFAARLTVQDYSERVDRLQFEIEFLKIVNFSVRPSFE